MAPISPRKYLPKPEGNHCIGCGRENPLGLNMTFYCVGNTLRSDVILNQHHTGWENLAHGGMISTILDEIMGWTVLAFRRLFFVTRRLEIHYLRPVGVNVPLTAVGEIDVEFAPRGCTTKAFLLDAAGTKLAEGRAEMAYLSEKRLPLLPEQYRKDMIALFEQIQRLLD